MSISRRSFVAGAGAAAFTATSVTDARAADAIAVGTLPIDAGGQPYYADSQGYFSTAGLDVSILPAQNSSLLLTAMLSGTTQFTLCNIVNLVEALQNGIALAVVAPCGLWSDDTTQLVVLKESPIASARDLSGKTIAVTGLKNLVTFAPQYWIDRNGGDAAKVRFIELSFPEMIPAMQAGRVDAAVTVEPFLTMSKNAIRPVTHSLLTGLSRNPLQSAVWVAESGWAKKNPRVVAMFNAAMVKAAGWANSNPAQSAQILARFSKMNPDIVAAMARVKYSTKLDAAQIQPLVDLTKKYGGFRNAGSIESAIFYN